MMAASALLLSASSFGQEDELSKKISRENVVRGVVVTLKGDTLKGYIRKMSIPTAEQLGYDPKGNGTVVSVSVPDAEFGSKVKFISEADFNAKEHIHENDYTKCRPDKYKGYVYDVDGSNIDFISMKVKDGVMKKENFVHVVRELPDGELLVDYYMSAGVDVSIFSGSPEYEDVEPFTHTHAAVYVKSQGIAVLVEDQKPEDFYAKRCPEVLKKWKNKEYTKTSKSKSSLLSKLENAASKIDSDSRDAARMKAFEDYLNTCAK